MIHSYYDFKAIQLHLRHSRIETKTVVEALPLAGAVWLDIDNGRKARQEIKAGGGFHAGAQ
jgi:hypothetical protein